MPFGVRGIQRIGDLDAEREQFSSPCGLPAMRCFSVWPSRNSMAMKVRPAPRRCRRWCRCWDDSAPRRRALRAGSARALRDLWPRRRAETSGPPGGRAHVLGLVNHPHPPAAKLLDDAVVGNRAANQRGRVHHRPHMLGWCRSQVNEHRLFARQRRRGAREIARAKQPRNYCSFAYSALASLRMGMSGSASFQSAKKSL